jgi:hypothetical protein
MKFLIMQFSSDSCYFPPFESSHSPSTLFSNTLAPYSSLNVRNQVPHPYKKLATLQFSFIFWTAGVEAKDAELKCSKHCQQIICSTEMS